MKKIISCIAILSTVMAVSIFAVALTASAQTTASTPQSVGSTLEVHIYNNGTALVRGAKVSGVSGNAISATTTFGSYSINWTVGTSSSTNIIKRYGGATVISNIQNGDFISFSGVLNTVASQATVDATSVRDWSLQTTNSTFSGTVSSINATANSFVLATPSKGNITVNIISSTQFTKDGTTVTISNLNVGDKILQVSGLYDNLSQTLQASTVKVYVNQGLLNERTFQGTLQSVAGTTAPTTLTVTIGSTNFTINVPVGISILNKNWLQSSLVNFKAGNTIRIYGAVEVNNNTTIDASVVRDTNI